MTALRHTRTGWWLEEATGAAGPVMPAPPLAGDTSADVLVVGGGYLGMWTAWQLKQLEPECDVLSSSPSCAGTGRAAATAASSRRSGTTCRCCAMRVGDARPSRCAARPSARSAGSGAGATRTGRRLVRRGADDGRRHLDAQIGDWDEVVARAARWAPRRGHGDRRGRGAAPLRVAALSRWRAAARRRCERPARRGCARASRQRLLDTGVRIHEHTRVRRLARDGVAETEAGTDPARAAVLAVNAAAAGFAGHRLSLAVASSHIVLTEPVPDVLDELGWTGGEAICDSRTMLHYLRTTRDGRIAFGWGGGRMGLGGRRRQPRGRRWCDRHGCAQTCSASSRSSPDAG